MRFIVITVLILMASLDISLAQGWRGIKPLRSTCEDVKRALGVDKCDYPKSVYRFKEETITVGFIMCPCPILCYHESSGWNVPIGTVGGITRDRRIPLPISDFDVDSSKWKKTETDMIGQLLYNNYEDGVALSAINGKVFTIRYYAPSDKNEDLACPPCTVPPPPDANEPNPSSWFSAYEDISFDQEQKYLDTFAKKLKVPGEDSVGYIVVYDSCRERGEAVVRAERAKKYLVSTYGIENSRIRIIDGGQRDEMQIELQVRARSLPPPGTSSSTYPALKEPRK
jgi:hypothetical protein